MSTRSKEQEQPLEEHAQDAAGLLHEGRAAKQTIFEAMSHVVGCEASTLFSTHIVYPSDDPNRCDSTKIGGTIDLRRLRLGSPLSAFGLYFGPDGPSGTSSLTTLEGKTTREPEAYLLDEFCTQPIPPLVPYRKGEMYRFALGADEPPVGASVTLVRAYKGTADLLRYQDELASEEFFGSMTRIPHRVFIQDIIVHEDIYPDAIPIVTTKMRGTFAEGITRTDPFDQLDALDLKADVEALRIDQIATKDVPRYAEIVQTAFTHIGWNPAAFRVHRLRFMYPIPGVEMLMWFDLPEQ